MRTVASVLLLAAAAILAAGGPALTAAATAATAAAAPFPAAAASTKHVRDKVVVITGATSGIGEAAAVHLARKGAKLVLAGRRQEQGDRVVAACNEAAARGGGGSGGGANGDGDVAAVFVRTDVSVAADVANLFAQAKATFGGVDSVFANAGVGDFGEYVDAEDGDAVVARLVNVNVLGTMLTTRHALKALRERGGGSLIFTSSVFGANVRGMWNMFGRGSTTQVYGATKSFIDGLARNLVAEQPEISTYSLAPFAYTSEMCPDTDGVAGMAAASHTFFKSSGDVAHIAEMVEHFVAGSTLWPAGSLVTCEGPFTFDGHFRYSQLYDFDRSPRALVTDMPASEVRDVQGRRLGLTAEEVKEISDAAIAARLAKKQHRRGAQGEEL